MRLLVQRVSTASVRVGDEVIAQIGRGVLVFVAAGGQDQEEHASSLAEKVAHLRIFEDAAGKTNLSVLDIQGEALVVSQFTLFGDAKKGRRPSFVDAAPPGIAEPLITHFAECLRLNGVPTRTGAFGAHMMVEIHNDGPFTIWLEN